MSRFLQLHFLTFYPPSNLNRDDTGRPKSAVIGGTNRLRISSQALKRAWRTSDLFEQKLKDHLASRTQRLGDDVLAHLIRGGMAQPKAIKTARDIAGVFGKIKGEDDKNPARIEQLAFVSPEERAGALALADRALAGESIEPKAADLLKHMDHAADLAMFGRMLAGDPDYNREAAVQVAHAFTTHKVSVEDDFYTAVDDLKLASEDAGAGFIGETGFGAGVFYLYACVDRQLLEANLGDNKSLAADAVAALLEAAATVAPGGKQNSFASRARAHYVLAERGNTQPRTLAAAFTRSVEGDQVAASVEHLRDWRDALDRAYGDHTESSEMLVGGEGSLAELLTFVRG
jgi:CRISPR system Cascade subunit CasC